MIYFLGVTSAGFAHTTVQLKPNLTYYTTVRGITNDGNVLESVSDGFTVDWSPPTVVMDRYTEMCCLRWIKVDYKVIQSFR